MNTLARAILDVVLEERGLFDQQVVERTTHKSWRPPLPEDLEKIWVSMLNRFAYLRRDTCDDYHLRNGASVVTKELFGEHPKLIYPDNLKEVFKSGGILNGWDKFHEAFPDSHGVMSIGQPGFSADQRQALIDVGEQVHFMSGRGSYYLCEFDGAEWRVIGEDIAWRS